MPPKSWSQDAATGSRVYVDGKYVGGTPLNVPVPCDEVADRRYRIEHPTCGVQEGILDARILGGAITGMVFTFGILAIFLGVGCSRLLDTAARGLPVRDEQNDESGAQRLEGEP